MWHSCGATAAGACAAPAATAQCHAPVSAARCAGRLDGIDRNGLLFGVVGLVFTDAVLEAAQGSSTIRVELWVSSVLPQTYSFTPGHIHLGDIV